MTPTENLHYAIGQLAYAVAKIDGRVQTEERNRFTNIVATELRHHDQAFNVTDIIFQILDKENVFSSEEAYETAMHQIRMNSHYLSPELKEKFIKVMEKIALAFPPVTPQEMSVLERFEAEFENINGDPVYYKN